MTETERAVLPYLRHIHTAPKGKCLCPPESLAPCGGQYEGGGSPQCPQHGHGRTVTTSHYPAGCSR